MFTKRPGLYICAGSQLHTCAARNYIFTPNSYVNQKIPLISFSSRNSSTSDFKSTTSSSSCERYSIEIKKKKFMIITSKGPFNSYVTLNFHFVAYFSSLGFATIKNAAVSCIKAFVTIEIIEIRAGWVQNRSLSFHC